MKTTKYILFFLTFAFSLFTFSVTFAQMTVKDGDENTLLQVNDYGTSGTVTLPPFTGILPTLPINNQMLYNFDGTLYFNGSALGTSNNAAGWIHSGTNIYNTILTDNVGIGTNNPLSKLSVGGDGFAGVSVYGVATAIGNITNYGGYFRADGNSGGGVYGEATATGDAANYGGIFIASGNSGIGVYSLATGPSAYAGYFNGRGYFSGNVGIGIETPVRKFEVVANGGGATAEFYNTNSAGDGIRIKIGPNSNPDNGNDYIFFLDGDATAIGSVEGNGSGGVSYNTTSDARLKTKIREYSNALETVSQIGIKKYIRISNPGIEEIGVIAQELQKVYPQAVSGSPYSDVKTDPMMVDYSKLTPLLVKGMQEQQERIKELEKQNSNLENRLNKIESLLDGKRFTSVSK